jgi:hypothetical protein
MKSYSLCLRKYSVLGMLLLCGAILGCKKYYDPPAVFEKQEIVSAKKRKVLLIGIDGATGEDVKKIMPPIISSILPNSKYSWQSRSDAPVSDAGTWKNIMTGIATIHKIQDSSFVVPESANEHEAVVEYPSIIERLQATPKMKYAVAVSPWKTMIDKLLIYADEPIAVSDDAAVADTAIKKLAINKADLVVVNFNQVNIAGLKYGYSADVAEYKAAVNQVDAYIGKLLEAVKARKTYANEEWLVVITSNHGGYNKGFTSQTDRERNSFNIYYHPAFKKTEIDNVPLTDAFLFPAAKAATDAKATLSAASSSIYEIGATGDKTIQFKALVRSSSTSNGQNFVLFSKSNVSYGTVNGWNFMVQINPDGTRKFRVTMGYNSSTFFYVYARNNFDLNKWYALTLKIYTQGSKRMAVLYVDGVAGDAVDISGRTIGNNVYDLFLGNLSTTTTAAVASGSFAVNDIAIYNKAISEAEIANFTCSDGIRSTDPSYANLIGYWPCKQVNGDKMLNQAPAAAGKDLVISGKGGVWNAFEKSVCNATAPSGNTVMAVSNSDIASQIIYWFGVNINESWKLSGKSWLKLYEVEFIKP